MSEILCSQILTDQPKMCWQQVWGGGVGFLTCLSIQTKEQCGISLSRMELDPRLRDESVSSPCETVFPFTPLHVQWSKLLHRVVVPLVLVN